MTDVLFRGALLLLLAAVLALLVRLRADLRDFAADSDAQGVDLVKELEGLRACVCPLVEED